MSWHGRSQGQLQHNECLRAHARCALEPSRNTRAIAGHEAEAARATTELQGTGSSAPQSPCKGGARALADVGSRAHGASEAGEKNCDPSQVSMGDRASSGTPASLATSYLSPQRPIQVVAKRCFERLRHDANASGLTAGRKQRTMDLSLRMWSWCRSAPDAFRLFAPRQADARVSSNTRRQSCLAAVWSQVWRPCRARTSPPDPSDDPQRVHGPALQVQWLCNRSRLAHPQITSQARRDAHTDTSTQHPWRDTWRHPQARSAADADRWLAKRRLPRKPKRPFCDALREER